MTEPKTLDVSHLLPYEIYAGPALVGQLLLAFIEAMMFSLLIASFFTPDSKLMFGPHQGINFLTCCCLRWPSSLSS